jgi:sulfite exporter TauE/SafE/copper chaperone CopZ
VAAETKTVKLYIGGMTCVNCQNKIEKKLKGTAGIKRAAVSYNDGTAVIDYDAELVSLAAITGVIQKLDYTARTEKEHKEAQFDRMIGFVAVVVFFYVLLERFGLLNLLAPSQLAEARMGYGMLFVIGLLTSVHCLAMCGGINLSQSMSPGKGEETLTADPISRSEAVKSSRLAAFVPTFLYNLGRVASYTAVGFAVGALGSVIIFSNAMQGVLKLVAGVFMIVMGLNMGGFFPSLRRLNPRMPKFIADKVNKRKGQSKSPLIVGLLNGFMPCGPLQAMQIYALSTGNPLAGALSMFLFSLGTVPLMFGLGALGSALGRKFMGKAMMVGAVLVVVLGLSMLAQGWNLSGLAAGAVDGRLATAPTEMPNGLVSEDGYQIVKSTLSSRGYPRLTVLRGIPVRWIIDAPQGSITGCNNRIFINEYDIEYSFKPGENIIEFMPDKAGTFQYTCWMGMISSTITVVEGE